MLLRIFYDVDPDTALSKDTLAFKVLFQVPEII